MPRKRGVYGTSPPSVRHRYAMEERKYFVPDFDQVLGHGHGYDADDPSVSPQNVKALLDSFFDYENLEFNDATRSWTAFWKFVNERQMFWWKYFTGHEIEVKSQLSGRVDGRVISEWLFADGVERESESNPRPED